MLFPLYLYMEHINDFDLLGNAVEKLFGLPYLFPYQRLVISNLLEAAMTAGLAVQWPTMGIEQGNSSID